MSVFAIMSGVCREVEEGRRLERLMREGREVAVVMRTRVRTQYNVVSNQRASIELPIAFSRHFKFEFVHFRSLVPRSEVLSTA